VQKQLNQGI